MFRRAAANEALLSLGFDDSESMWLSDKLLEQLQQDQQENIASFKHDTSQQYSLLSFCRGAGCLRPRNLAL